MNSSTSKTLGGVLCFFHLTMGFGVAAAEQVAWNTRRIHDRFYTEGASAGDIDGDGKPDIVAGPLWYRGPEFEQSFEIAAAKQVPVKAYSDQFFSHVVDVNGDGANDVIVIGFPGRAARLYLNPGHDRLDQHWTESEITGAVDNESPAIVDLIPGGLPEIVCGRDTHYGYYEAGDDPTQPWSWNPVTRPGACSGRFAHGLGVGDVNNDGLDDILDRTSWWEHPSAPSASDGGDGAVSQSGEQETAGSWRKRQWADENYGRGGAQICVNDVDADGDNDIITSLNAHGYGLAWFEQQDDGAFERHQIMGETSLDNPHGVVFSQLHAVALSDIDGDGIQDVITGKRYYAHGGKDVGGMQEPVLYWFRCVPNEDKTGVAFVPHRIHSDSGVGTDVLVSDLNQDGRPDVVTSSKRGLLIHLQDPQGDAQRPERWQVPEGRDQSKYSSGLTPEEAVAKMMVPDGFEIDLIASEPDLTQPIAMCFDARGRIWVVEGHTYPVKAERGKGKDRILIFEDQDADGSFESRKVFATGLNLVSGIEVGFGGVWVGAAPELLFIPDKDRDDVPDGEPQVLLDGWGYQDTHETLNSFTWGPDGWLYGCHGVFTHSRVGKPGTPNDARIPLNAGVWRYHPTHHRFEVFAHGTSNPWGIDFDNRGEWFLTACVIPHLFHIQQGARYQRQAGRHFNPHTYDDIKTIADHAHYAGSIREHAFWGENKTARPAAAMDTSLVGGGHAHCGLAIYNGGAFPKEYNGDLLFHNLHGHRLVREQVDRNGSGFIGKHRPDFALTRDHHQIGVGVMVGPDGAIYTSDWHDPQTCHHRDTEIWDRTNGRLFRIRYGDVRPTSFDLSRESDLELVRRLSHPNGFFVRQSQRILQERAAEDQLDRAEVTAALDQILHSDRPQRERLRALWTRAVIGGFDEESLIELFDDRDPYVRGWAIHFLGDSKGSLPGHVHREVIEFSRTEENRVVRRYLASLLQRIPVEQRWQILESLVSHPADGHDPNLPYLIWFALEPGVAAEPERALELARRSGWPQLLKFTIRRAAATPVGRNVLVEDLTNPAHRASVELVLQQLLDAATRRSGVEMPQGWSRAFAQLKGAKTASIRQLARSLGVQFGDQAVVPYFRRLLADRAKPREQRLRALTALKTAGDRDLPAKLYPLLDDPEVAAAVATALAEHDASATPEQLIRRLDDFNRDARAAALNTLVSRPDYASELIAAMETERVAPGSVPAFIVRQVMTLEEPSLNRRLEETWGKISTSGEDKRAAIRKYRGLLRGNALAEANASNGRAVYAANCGNCHKLFGTGGDIGPEITGANRSDINYWLENIIQPNALIGRDYRMTTLLLTSGRVVNGIIEEENEDAITVQTATEEVVIAQEEIDQRVLSDVSLMPEGQLETLSTREIRDLFRYLTNPTQVPLPDDQTSNDQSRSSNSEPKKLVSTEGDGAPPNFVIVFCDDMGYGDIGPFGAKGYKTPNLDRMAREGTVFRDFYVGRSFCSPSRAALMTGCIPTRVGVGGNFNPRSKTGLHPDETTIAEVLKARGYATACFGKWHLGHRTQFLPTSQGFDEFFGLPYSNDMWPFHPNVRHLPMEQRLKRWPHLPLYEGDRVVNPKVMPADQIELTKRLTERAVDFIARHRSDPFFLYLPNPQPHVPLFATDRFTGTTERGLYGDVIRELDWQMGQLLQCLKRTGVDDRTCVVFTSDNGPWLAYGDHAGSAGPLREGKGTNFEGGFRVSCVMRWPGRIPAGGECTEIAGTIDLLPTFAKIASAPLPKNKIDGKDISPLMFGEDNAQSPHEVFYHYDGRHRLMAVRSGRWKLMFPQTYSSPLPGSDGVPGENRRKEIGLSLFDLKADIGETTNVAEDHPEIVEQLMSHAAEIREELGDGQVEGSERRPLGG